MAWVPRHPSFGFNSTVYVAAASWTIRAFSTYPPKSYVRHDFSSAKCKHKAARNKTDKPEADRQAGTTKKPECAL